MNAASGDIHVIVVCPQPGMDHVFRNIREWCHKIDDHLPHAVVDKYLSLPDALEAAREDTARSILIALGYKASEVHERLIDGERHNLEIIIRPPRPTLRPEPVEFPSSSLLADSLTVNVQDTISALRKSLLRMELKKMVTIRPLERGTFPGIAPSKQDFQSYFRLRYQVWKEMGYLPAHRDCPETQMEIDFTDRTAIPIGAFTSEGTLIGCARLVFPFGSEVPRYVRIINDLVAEQGSAILSQNLKYPEKLNHPFDLLESFRGFREYYARLVRDGVRKAEVSRVIVAPSYRQHGLGEVLVDSLVSMARDLRLEVLFLACHGSHRGFYQRCGFRVLEGLECERFAGVNAPAIAMDCKLTSPQGHSIH